MTSKRRNLTTATLAMIITVMIVFSLNLAVAAPLYYLPPDGLPSDAGYVLINGGAASTTSTSVTLTIQFPGPPANAIWVSVMVSNDASFSAASTFSDTTTDIPWTLTPGLGTKTVYVKFIADTGTTSSASDSIDLVSSNTIPTISLTTPSANQTISGTGAVNISGTVTDPDSPQTIIISAEVAGVSKSITVSTPASSKAWNLSWLGTELAGGSYTASITVTANDGIGSGTAAYTGDITVDKTAPTVNIPTTGSITQTGFVAIGNATDANGPLQYLFNLNGTDQGTWQSSSSYTFAGVTANTTYIVKYKAKDAVGNTSAFSAAASVTTAAIQPYQNPPVPTGFTYVTGTWDTGYVIQDTVGNQWVWVPVGGISGGLTTRTTNGYPSIDNMPANIKNAIDTSGGFYISRYEASNNGSGTPQSKANQTVWNNTVWGTTKTNVSNMGSTIGYPSSVITHLPYDSEYDTILQWMKDSGANITDSRSWGNYADDIPTGNNGLMVTGANSAFQYKNIYDIAGNISEWSQGYYFDNVDGANYYNCRGGSYITNGSINGANSVGSYRLPQVGVGFRAAFVYSTAVNQNPVISISTPTTNQTYTEASGNNIITITGKVSDTDANKVTVSATIGGIEKSIDINSAPISQPGSDNFTLTWNINTDGIAAGTYNGILVKADDGAGGISTSTLAASLTVSKSAPTGSIIIDKKTDGTGQEYTNVNPLKITVNASDDNSALNNIKIFVSETNTTPSAIDSGWANFPASGIYNYNYTGPDGVVRIYAWFKDEAGNISSVTSDDIIFDATPATGTVSIGESSTDQALLTLNFTKSPSNTYADVHQVIVSNNSDFTNSQTFDYPASNTIDNWAIDTSYVGTKTIYVKYLDWAGNISDPFDDSVDFTGPSTFVPIFSNNQVLNVGGQNVEVLNPDTAISGISSSLEGWNMFENLAPITYDLSFEILSKDVSDKLRNIKVDMRLNDLGKDGIELTLNRAYLKKYNDISGKYETIKYFVANNSLSNPLNVVRLGKNRYEIDFGKDDAGNPIIKENGPGKYQLVYGGVVHVTTGTGIEEFINEINMKVYSTNDDYPDLIEVDSPNHKLNITTRVTRQVIKVR